MIRASSYFWEISMDWSMGTVFLSDHRCHFGGSFAFEKNKMFVKILTLV